MATIKLGGTLIKRDGNRVYFIAEIGQNHQGDLDLAKKMIIEAKRIGCDCVKFQKSCIEEKFTDSALKRPYESEHSWGKTYGEHKAFLEFDIEQYKLLQTFCQRIGIDFTASAMDEVSLYELNALEVPFIKIGSGDANNFPLLERAACLVCPLVISTGMQTMKTIEQIVNIMRKANKLNYALLHCVSSYPTEAKDCQLGMIPYLRKRFSQCVIGYSGHELGIEISQAAVLLGARIVERHFTLDKLQRGSDHKCSLLPLEMRMLINFIKELEKNNLSQSSNLDHITKKELLKILTKTPNLIEALNSLKHTQERTILPCELACRLKLGKSIVAKRNLVTGQTISLKDLCIKVSEPNGISAEYIECIVGAELSKNITKDSPLTWDYVTKLENTKF